MTIKKTVKYLSVAPDSLIAKSILQRAPEGVIRAIANAALIARSGEVHGPQHLKLVFRRHNKLFDYLTDNKSRLSTNAVYQISRAAHFPLLFHSQLRQQAYKVVSSFREQSENMSSFSKKVMIDAAELDQMQQTQIRKQSPELHSLAQLHNQMIDIIGNKTLLSDQNLNLLSNYQGRFDKLQKETSVFVREKAELRAFGDLPEPIPQVLVSQPNVEQSVGMIEKLGIKPMYRNKTIKFFDKIEENLIILTYNKDGQLIIEWEPLPGTNFESLFKSMISPNPYLDQVGTDRFLGALHEIGVKPAELSGKAVQNRLAQSNKLKEVKSDDSLTEYKTLVNKRASPGGKEKKPVAQKGKRLQQKTPTPTGTRPNILHVN